MWFLYIFLFITSILFYILYKGIFSFYLFAFLLIFPIILLIINKYIARNIFVQFVNFNKTAHSNDKVPIELEVINHTIFPVANLIIELEIFSVLDSKKNTFKINTPVFPKESQRMTLNFSSYHYGCVEIKVEKCKVCDIFKLFKTKVKLSKINTLKNVTSYTIIPEIVPIEASVTNYGDMGIESNEYSPTQKGDDPSEIFDIREYTDGDKISRIHWKISAKQGITMVKDYSLPLANSIVILIDLGIAGSEENSLIIYDTIIECAISICGFLTENKISYSVEWCGSNLEKDVKLDLIHISSEDDLNLFVKNLLQAPINYENNLVVKKYLASNTLKKCGNLIYISSKYDSNISKMLYESDLAYKYSYMIVNNNTTQEDDKYIQIVPIEIKKISESLEGFCF